MSRSQVSSWIVEPDERGRAMLTGHELADDPASKALIRGLQVAVSRGLFALLAVLVALGAGTPVALASDVSLTKALKRYETRLTSDIAYLSSFAAPSKTAAPAALRALSKIRRDLTGAIRAANGQQASTSTGREARTLVLSGLHYATGAAGHAKASATAARSGAVFTAKHAARAEQTEIHKAIPLFERGGKLLHLF